MSKLQWVFIIIVGLPVMAYVVTRMIGSAWWKSKYDFIKRKEGEVKLSKFNSKREEK